MGALGDTDGDGIYEVLGFAARSDINGQDLGALYKVTLDEEPEYVAMDVPVSAQNDVFGRRAKFVGDHDDDQVPEVAVGAFRQNHVDYNATNSGAVNLYSGSLDGARHVDVPDDETSSSEALSGMSSGLLPIQTLAKYPGHSTNDATGYDVAPAGDFDGDGQPDL